MTLKVHCTYILSREILQLYCTYYNVVLAFTVVAVINILEFNNNNNNNIREVGNIKIATIKIFYKTIKTETKLQ